MLSALATGTIIRPPKFGTSTSGTRWANSTLRVPCGQSKEGDQEAAFVTVVCFGDHADRLAKLDKGDALSVQGQLKPTDYQKDGQERHGLEIVAQALAWIHDRKAKGLAFERNAPGQGDTSSC
jgi:single-stranded DNA-binding protein